MQHSQIAEARNTLNLGSPESQERSEIDLICGWWGCFPLLVLYVIILRDANLQPEVKYFSMNNYVQMSNKSYLQARVLHSSDEEKHIDQITGLYWDKNQYTLIITTIAFMTHAILTLCSRWCLGQRKFWSATKCIADLLHSFPTLKNFSPWE